MRSLLALILAACFLVNPCLADVMQKKAQKPDMKGLTQAESNLTVSKLTPQDAGYFAQDSNRVQIAGQTPANAMWWHWVLGWSYFLGVGLGVYFIWRATE